MANRMNSKSGKLKESCQARKFRNCWNWIKKADEAYFKCKKIVKELLPEMNLVIGEYTFDESKLIFYFTASNRLDFRELVKEVNRTFKKRVDFIRLRQMMKGRILSAFGNMEGKFTGRISSL